MTACFGGDPRDRGRDTVEDEIDAIVEMLGLTEDDYSVQGYRARPTPDAEGCPDVEDKWVGTGTATVRHGVVDQDTIVRRLADRYRDHGATMRLWQSTAGPEGGQVLVALDPDRRLALRAHVSLEGHISLTISHTSCSVDDYSTDISGPYEEVPVPD